MEDNKISVIIPVYNLEAYVERAVRSVLQQTYTNIEVLIVDDGSTDNSWKVIQRIAASDNRVIPIRQENKGVTSARINGIRHATGQWIGFVDGDDEIETDMYELLIENGKKYGADISHCGYQMIFEDGRVHYFYGTGNLIQQDYKKGVKDLLDGSIIEPGLWNKLYKKSLFEKVFKEQNIPESIKINEDLLMNYYLFSKSRKAVFKDVCKYHYFVRTTSITHDKFNMSRIYDPIVVKKIILESVPLCLKEDALKAYLSTCINVYNNILIENINKIELDRIRKLIKERRELFFLLRKKQYILAGLIYYFPHFYSIIYKIYVRFLLKRKYR